MSATVNFITASHIWCCDEHDVLGQSYSSSLVWDMSQWLVTNGSRGFHVLEYICHIFVNIQKSSFMLH
jgi:hypothetical protein